MVQSRGWSPSGEAALSGERVERRLTAILAADVVGYSRLIGVDEEGTLNRLRSIRAELIDPKITEHRGRIIKTTGDGLLAEFASVVDTVRCAVAVQLGMAERNREFPNDHQIVFRVGINLGDVVVEHDGDLMGDGVNVAARLESIAKPGSICLSRSAYDQIKGKFDVPVRDLGDQRLKNIAEPVRAYSIELGGRNALAPFRRVLSSQSRIVIAGAVLIFVLAGIAGVGTYLLGRITSPSAGLSLVVLPFSNLGGDPGQEYLADVLTGELTTYISRLPGTFVIAGTSAFSYKGKTVDVRQVGKDLQVRYVLEGSVQPSGNHIRTNARLVDAKSGAYVWAEQFDEDKSCLFATQEAIASRLARTLQIKFASVEVARSDRARSVDSDPDKFSLRCYAIFLDRSNLRGGIEAAYPLCEKALQIDPSNVRALSILARLFAGRVASQQSADPHGDLIKADEMVSRAMAVDPNQSLARQAKAFVLLWEGNTAEAIVEAQRAVALNPSDIGAHAAMCFVLDADGQYTIAIECAEKAIRLSPRDPFLWAFYNQIAIANMALYQYGRAIEWLRRSIAENPDFPAALEHLTSVLALDDHEAEAIETLARYLAHPRTNAKTIDQVRTQGRGPFAAATFERYLQGLRKAGMPEE